MFRPWAKNSASPSTSDGRDRLRVQLALEVVRDQDHDQVGFLARLGGRGDPQAVVERLLPALGAFGQADPHVHAGIAERERVRVSLAAVSEHGDVPALDHGQVGAVVVENLCHLKWAFLCEGYSASD